MAEREVGVLTDLHAAFLLSSRLCQCFYFNFSSFCFECIYDHIDFEGITFVNVGTFITRLCVSAFTTLIFKLNLRTFVALLYVSISSCLRACVCALFFSFRVSLLFFFSLFFPPCVSLCLHCHRRCGPEKATMRGCGR